jgi:predicted sulfurtransferase
VSSYFNNLFFAEWKEKGQQEEVVVIHEEDDPNFDIGTFQLMIHAALSLGWMVPELLELFKGCGNFTKM